MSEPQSSPDPGSGDACLAPWKMLVVDDDEAVHQVTELALMDFEYAEREIEMLHAHSAAEGRELLQENPDVALIFLDVVMESETAGLDFVRFVRGEMENQQVRIILRTGQAARLSVREVLEQFDINHFCEKTELTDDRMFVVVYSALRDYELLLRQEALHRELEKCNEKLTAFVNISAHDIQAPLRKIKWRAGRAASKLDEGDTSAASQELQQVGKQIDQLRGLLASLLEYARLGNVKPKLEPVSLNDILQHVMSSLDAQLRACTGTLMLPSESPRILGEPSLLAIMFQNLASNALKFSGEGMLPIVRIEVEPATADDPPDTVWICVSDNGTGIDPESIERIFQPFERASSASDREGAGLGLAIVRNIVDEHDGDIRVRSKPGEGASFSVRLPLAGN